MKASNATSSKAARGAGPRARTDSSSSTARHFCLDGPSRPVDARIHAWRKDLADISLAGQVFAPHYARPLPRACGAHAAMLWPGPAAEGEAVSELLPGELFCVLEYAGGWAWGFSAADHVVAYAEGLALADPIQPTHYVCEKWAPVTPDEALGAPVIANLPMGARLHGTERGACLVTEYGCVPLSHLRAAGDDEADPATVGERLLGAPFLAGGRSANGVDAPALVQLALSLCGLAAPRLLDQLAACGAPAQGSARRGDLVLWDGSVGLMIDDLMMIHASRDAGKVVVEPAPRSGAEWRRPPL